MDRERALNLEAAAGLAGTTPRELRRHLKEGHLPQTTGPDGKPRVTVGDLADAGLVPVELVASAEEGPKVGNGSGANGGDGNGGVANGGESHGVGTGLQTWRALGDSGEILRHLLAEREQAASAWKERTESLYRELVDEQRERIGRLEEEKRELVDRLHDALRQVPKLLELEKVERSAREATIEAERLREESVAAKARVFELERQGERLQDALTRADERRGECEASLRRLRQRGLWSRMLDRDPLPPEA